MKNKLVQVCNPITKHWVLINKTTGTIIKHSRTKKPYKNIEIAGKNYNEN